MSNLGAKLVMPILATLSTLADIAGKHLGCSFLTISFRANPIQTAGTDNPIETIHAEVGFECLLGHLEVMQTFKGSPKAFH